MTGPYKFTSKMTDYTLQVDATPEYEAITRMYRELIAGIDQELIRNMPNMALVKLLSQLLESFLSRQPLLGAGTSEAHMMAIALKAEYDV